MKNNNLIKSSVFVSFLILSALTFTGCYDDDGGSPIIEAVRLDLNPKTLSQFDEEIEFNITSLSTLSDIQVSTAALFSGATELGSTPLSGNTGSVSTTLAAIGLSDLKEDVIIDIVSTEEGGVRNASYPVSLYNPTEASLTATTLEAQTSVADTLNYTITTQFATADKVIIEQKVSSTGTYLELAGPDAGLWPVDKGSYIFKSEDFAIIKDTLFLKVTANKGAISASSGELKIFIDTQKLDETSDEFSFTSSNLEVDLANVTTGSNPEIVYVDPNTISAATSVDITFAEITTDGLDIFDDADKIKANEAYMANPKSSSITNITPDDVYVYNINRENKDGDIETFIGLLKIGAVSVLDSMGNFSVEISYLEEKM